jgi:phenylalanine-4-hydroxylase
MADFILKNVHILVWEGFTKERTGLTPEQAMDIILDGVNGLNKIHSKILSEYNVSSIVSSITNIQLEDIKKETNLNLGSLSKLNSQAKKTKV